jgi:probable rRNA maturation factor
MMVAMAKQAYSIQTKYTHLYFRTSVTPFLKKRELTGIIENCLLCFEQFMQKELKLKAKQMEINLTICGAKKMTTINGQFRNKQKTTDVLSFPIESLLYKEKELPAYLTQLLMLGDIVICKEVLLRQAKSFQVSVTEEFVRLFIHGLLHLTDMDHERSKAEEKMMFEIQDRLIAKVLKKLKS